MWITTRMSTDIKDLRTGSCQANLPTDEAFVADYAFSHLFPVIFALGVSHTYWIFG